MHRKSLVSRADVETGGNAVQVIVKAKCVAAKPFMVKVENRKFIKDSRKELPAEATLNVFIERVGSSATRFYFTILVCSTALQKRPLLAVRG